MWTVWAVPKVQQVVRGKRALLTELISWYQLLKESEDGEKSTLDQMRINKKTFVHVMLRTVAAFVERIDTKMSRKLRMVGRKRWFYKIDNSGCKRRW